MDRLITTGLPQSKVRMNCRDIVMITDRQTVKAEIFLTYPGVVVELVVGL